MIVIPATVGKTVAVNNKLIQHITNKYQMCPVTRSFTIVGEQLVRGNVT